MKLRINTVHKPWAFIVQLEQVFARWVYVHIVLCWCFGCRNKTLLSNFTNIDTFFLFLILTLSIVCLNQVSVKYFTLTALLFYVFTGKHQNGIFIIFLVDGFVTALLTGFLVKDITSRGLLTKMFLDVE